MHSSRSNTEMCCQLAFYLRSIYIYTCATGHTYSHIHTHTSLPLPLSLSLPSHLVYKLTYFALRARHKEFHLPFNIKLKCTRGEPHPPPTPPLPTFNWPSAHSPLFCQPPDRATRDNLFMGGWAWLQCAQRIHKNKPKSNV